jgi:multidrug efflux pump subunit AcrB
LRQNLAARVLRHNDQAKPGRLSRGLDRIFEAMAASYDRILIVALRHRFVTLMILLGTIALTVALL